LNQKTKYLLAAAAVLVVLVAAYLAYDQLADTYTPDTVLSETAAATTVPSGTGQTTTPAQTTAIRAWDFTVYDSAGNPVKLSDFFGRPTVVNFWASWCGPCKSEMPTFERAYQTYGNEVSFLMVDMIDGAWETQADAEKFLSGQNYTFPVYFDNNQYAAMAYGIYSIPSTLFINADGTVHAAYRGTLSEQTLFGVIETMIGESDQ
jgi:thiol-disulfide isomerase/thioredoxin